MKFWWVILFLTSFAFTQQELELCDGEELTYTYFSQTSDPGYNEWEVNGVYYYSEELVVTWSDTGVYVINLVRNNDGCPSDPISYTVNIKRCQSLIYYIPNAFTPDGDNFNQNFTPIFTYGFDKYDYHFIVYNRWGEIVFESFDSTKGWDGNYGGIPCQDGVYTWKVEFGLTINNNKIVERGHVTLIR